MRTEIDKQDQEWKVVASVGSVFGTTLNSKQLSEALKNKIFNPDGKVILHLKTGEPYPVRLIFKCSECENIHLLGCADELTPGYKKYLFEKDIIYLDRTDKDSYVSVEDLISLLDNFKDGQNISMECDGGEDEDMKGTWTCTQILKCPTAECGNAHLTCYYEDEVS